MMRRVFAGMLSVVLVGASAPVPASAAHGPTTTKAAPRLRQNQNQGQICGSTKDASQKPTAKASVRLRDQRSGALIATSTSDDNANYCFAGLPFGTFVVEMLDAAGNIVGTSASITLSTGAVVASGVTVTSTAAGVIGGAAGGAGGAAAGAGVGGPAAGAAAGAGSFFGSTLGIVTLVSVGTLATFGTIRAVTNNASPSQ